MTLAVGFGGACLKCERVKFSAHPALKGLIDHLVLLNAGLAGKRARDDECGVVIAVTREILDCDLRIGQAFLDQAFDCTCVHRHRVIPRSVLSAAQ